MTSQSIEDYRARKEDAPLDLVRTSADWAPVVRLVDRWTKVKIDAKLGYSSQELDRWARARNVCFPPVLREWWRLAGRHPFVDPGTRENGSAWLLGPHERDLVHVPDFLTISVDDLQTWSCSGIHMDFLSESDPDVHGVNATISPKDDPSLDWYKDEFIATGLSVPALIFATLLRHLLEAGALVQETVVYLEVDRSGLLGGEPDGKLVSSLGLSRYPNVTIVGDIYSDNEDIIYWWLMGCACRTAEVADRVGRTTPTRRRRIR